MKKSDDLRPEYGADFFKDTKPNRFAERPKLGRARTAVGSAKRVAAKSTAVKSSKKR